MKDTENVYFIGVDVGSGSVRAALVDKAGHVIKTSVKELQIWKPKIDFYEQSSNDVWKCCISVLKNILENVNPADVKGIGFDATSASIVALDKKGDPLAVSNSNDDERNIIMWMDHRAQAEADLINKTNHDVLKYVGGKISLEMKIPKLLWLKNNMPDHWPHYGHFFDLPDFLTWKATGSYTRSLCSLVCKSNYECLLDGEQRWNTSFFKQIGLGDLAEDIFKKIGNQVLMPGEFCGGLIDEVADKLGLKIGTPVGTSMIDGYAGALGMIGVKGKEINDDMSTRLALICGTSTVHVAMNKNPVLVDGVWGPFFSAIVPEMYFHEGGQSASGMLLDHIIFSHAAYGELIKTRAMGEVRKYLRDLLQKMASERNLPNVSMLTNDFHIWPDFHGNRSPLADHTMNGMMIGLNLDSSEEDLALKYLATLQALSYGTRHIIDSLVTSGYEPFRCLLICGGIAKDPLFIQIQADVAGVPILKPHEPESVLVGAAILGACASKVYTIHEAIDAMGGTADVVGPNDSIQFYHEKKYRVFLEMCADQLKYRKIMKSVSIYKM